MIKNHKNTNSLSLNFERSFDLEMAQDAEFNHKILFHDSILDEDMLFNYNTELYNDDNVLNTSVVWDNAILGNVTINDIGLTGVDNGRVLNMSGETMTFDSNSKFDVYKVGGSNEYPVMKAFDSSINKSYIELGGGFFQNFYKLHDYPFEVIPNRTSEGFTLDFWLKFSDNTLMFSGTTGTTLNQLYPDNKGIFFYMGSRAENKYLNNFIGESGLTTSSGVLLNSSGDTKNNYSGLAFLVNDEDKIGFRKTKIRQIDISGNTLTSIVEGFSEYPIYKGQNDNQWINVTISFKRNQFLKPNECGVLMPLPKLLWECEEVPASQKGELIFYINARPIYRVKDWEEVIFTDLGIDKEKQQGVPYNISIGGGTQGLLESQTFGGPDLNDRGLMIENNFAGTFEGGIGSARMYGNPLSTDKVIHNFKMDRAIYHRTENFGGSKIIINPPFTK